VEIELVALVVMATGLGWLDGDLRTGRPQVDRAVEYVQSLALQVFMKALILGTVVLLGALLIGAFV
jgi:hypothetical protein